MSKYEAKGYQIDLDLDAILKEVAAYTDEGVKAIAEEVELRARRTDQFTDKTGKLRRSISKKKAKGDDAAYYVVATAPHSHLVEIGHRTFNIHGTGELSQAKVDAERKSGRQARLVGDKVEGRWFLVKARDSVKPEAERIAQVYLDKAYIEVGD